MKFTSQTNSCKVNILDNIILLNMKMMFSFIEAFKIFEVCKFGTKNYVFCYDFVLSTLLFLS